jgi:hypothetical protein
MGWPAKAKSRVAVRIWTTAIGYSRMVSISAYRTEGSRPRSFSPMGPSANSASASAVIRACTSGCLRTA